MQMVERQHDTVKAEDPKSWRVGNLPVRFKPAQHAALRKIAHEERVSLHGLMLEGVAEVLRTRGR